MKKYVISVILVVVLAILGWNLLTNPAQNIEQSSSTATSTVNLSSSTPAKLNSAATVVKDAAWNVLQNYLKFAKDKNISGLASLSYQLSDSCKNTLNISASSTDKTDCLNKINNVYNLGSNFRKADFTTVWYDSKQVILSTPWQYWDGQGVTGLTHSVIYFVEDAANIKVLYFNPQVGTFVTNSASSTRTETDKKLQDMTRDTDQDGISDYDENCTGQPTGCTKTNPNKRDSNGNGWWDGIEALFYKK